MSIKNKRHSRYANYAIIPNTLDIERLSKNAENRIPDSALPNTHWKGDFDYPLIEAHTVDINFQIALVARQLINQCRECPLKLTKTNILETTLRLHIAAPR